MGAKTAKAQASARTVKARALGFRVLGPLTVEAETGPLSIPGAKERLILAVLLARAGHVVSVDELIDTLWGDEPPATAAKSLQAHIVRLRDALEPDRPRGAPGTVIATVEPGYVARIQPEALDAARFEAALKDARAAQRAGAAATGIDILRRAMSEWRGQPYAEFAAAVLSRESDRLDALRQVAEEDLVEGQLLQGSHRELVGELEGLVAEEPLRERRWAQLMLALYRSGRQGDALAAFVRARQYLVEELGVEPGEELRQLQSRMLEQDPSLMAGIAGGARRVPDALADRTVPLAGRDDALAELLAWWDRAVDGAGPVIGSVTGDAQMGKTRLAAELAHRLAGRAAILYASALPASSDPLAILTRLATELDREDLIRPNTPPRDAGSQLGRLLGRLTSRDALLMVLDDLGDAGGPSLAAIEALLAALQETSTPATSSVMVLLLGQRAHTLPPSSTRRSLQLQPLALSDIVPIVARHVPETDATLAASDIAAVARGVPGLIHQEAAAWARRRLRRRVGAAVDRAAAGRQALRDARRHLAQELAGWQELEPGSAQAGLSVADLAAERSPYKGLARFEVSDAELFFGREALVHELVGRVAEGSFLGVVGPSGSGKSSVVRAGLLAALDNGLLPGSEQWPAVTVVPSSEPLADLKRALKETAAHTVQRARRVVVIDQLEQLFIACDDVDERRAFLDALAAASLDTEEPSAVVAVLRADYYGHLTLAPVVAALMSETSVAVSPMTAEEAQRAIELPARRAGLELEPGLAAAIAADVAGRSGALPLLSTALLELWERRTDRRLTWSAYRRIGGVRGAVARLAEDAYERLNDDERVVARRILLRTAGARDSQADEVVRRVPLDELASEGETGQRVLAALADRRLMTVDAAGAEVTHESLFREWPRLREWLDADRHGREVHRHLIGAAREWDRRGRDPDDLYRGARLVAAQGWARDHPDEANEVELAFLAASDEAATREANDARRRAESMQHANRRLKLTLGALGTMLLIALIAGGLAIRQTDIAEREATAAEAARQAAVALREDDLDRSLLLAAEAAALAPGAETRGTLLAALQRSPDVIRIVRTDGERLLRARPSPDGRLVAIASNTSRIHLWDWERGELVRTLRGDEQDGIFFLEFGNTDELYAAEWTRAGIVLHGWDVATGTETQRQVVPRELEHVTDIWLAPAQSFATIVRQSGEVHRLSLTDGSVQLVGTFDGELQGSVQSADGHRLAIVGMDRTEIWDGDGEIVANVMSSGLAALSEDGSLLGLGNDQGMLTVFDATSGRELRAAALHTATDLSAISFVPGSDRVVTSAADGSVALWDPQVGDIRRLTRGHAGPIRDLALIPGGATAVTVSMDGSAIAWDLAFDRRFGRRIARLPDGLTAWAQAAENEPIVTVGRDGLLTVLELPSARQKAIELAPEAGFPLGLAVSPDGETAYVTVEPGALYVVELATESGASAPVARHPESLGPVAVAPDGSGLVVGAIDGLWSFDSDRAGPLLERLQEGGPVWSVAFDPTGQLLAVGFDDGRAAVWSWPEMELVGELVVGARAITALSFHPHERLLFVGSATGDGELWQFDNGDRLRIARAHAGFVLGGMFSVDGSELITGGTDGSIKIWEVATGRPVGSQLLGTPNHWIWPVGPTTEAGLLAVQDDGSVWSWELSTHEWQTRACSVAGRVLSSEELERYLPGQAETSACRGESTAAR